MLLRTQARGRQCVAHPRVQVPRKRFARCAGWPLAISYDLFLGICELKARTGKLFATSVLASRINVVQNDLFVRFLRLSEPRLDGVSGTERVASALVRPLGAGNLDASLNRPS